MDGKYKITGIYYSKPRILRDANGEVLPARVGIWIDVGQLADFNSLGQKKVEEIIFDKELNCFKVFFVKGGMKTVPYLLDTEVVYEIDK
jgi:hypothetical protein